MKRKANPRPAARRRSAIALIVQDKRWGKDAATLRLIRRAAGLALAARPSGPLRTSPAGGEENKTAQNLLLPRFMGRCHRRQRRGRLSLLFFLPTMRWLKN
jgi:hypothetical protein